LFLHLLLFNQLSSLNNLLIISYLLLQITVAAVAPCNHKSNPPQSNNYSSHKLEARSTQATDIEVVQDRMQVYSATQITVIPPLTTLLAIVALSTTQITTFPATLTFQATETPPTKSKSATSNTSCLRNTRAHPF